MQVIVNQLKEASEVQMLLSTFFEKYIYRLKIIYGYSRKSWKNQLNLISTL